MSRDEGKAESRERKAEQREAALDTRENNIRAEEAAGADLKEEVQAILDDADERDRQADARDSQADDRDRADSFESFLHDKDFTPGARARRAAGIDRLDSKSDRASAADDRSRLTEDGSGLGPL